MISWPELEYTMVVILLQAFSTKNSCPIYTTVLCLFLICCSYLLFLMFNILCLPLISSQPSFLFPSTFPCFLGCCSSASNVVFFNSRFQIIAHHVFYSLFFPPTNQSNSQFLINNALPYPESSAPSSNSAQRGVPQSFSTSLYIPHIYTFRYVIYRYFSILPK